jgi:hypothetical protein
MRFHPVLTPIARQRFNAFKSHRASRNASAGNTYTEQQ